MEVVDVADQQIGPFRTHRLCAQSVGKIHDVDGVERALAAADARGVLAFAIAQDARGIRFVEGRPVLDPVAEPPHRDGGVFGKPRSGVPVLPAAAVFESLRQIPVVEADPGLDVFRHHGIDQPVIEFEADWIGCATAGREDARPGYAEAVSPGAELGHHRDVIAVAVVVVARDVARVAVVGLARCVRESVPDRRPASILPNRALDLVSRSRGAPEKPVGEAFRHMSLSFPARSIGAEPLTTHQSISATQTHLFDSRSAGSSGASAEMDRVSNWAWWTIAGGILLSPVFAFLVAVVVEILINIVAQGGIPALLVVAAAVMLGWSLFRRHRARSLAGDLLGDQA